MNNVKVQCVNIDDIEREIDYLSKYLRCPFHKLPVEIRKRYHQLKERITNIQNSDGYTFLFYFIQKLLRNYNNVEPNTIGGYLKGCLAHISFDGNVACTQICIGGLQPPSDTEGWLPCQYTIVEKNGCDMNVIRSGSDHAYIMSCHHSNGSLVPSDVHFLRKNKITHIKMIRVSADQKTYIPTTDDWIQISGGITGTDNISTVWLITVIILLVSIVITMWFLWL